MVKRPITGFLVLAAVTMATTACVPEDADPDVQTFHTTSQQIQGGEIDRTHPGVVGLVMTSGYSVGTCSGSLIAPNLVLTAQHCVAEIASEYIRCGRTSFGDTRTPRGVFVTTQTYLTNDASDYYEVAEIHTGEKGDVCDNDIALLVLAQNVPDNIATPYVPRIDAPVVRGEKYTAIGYGHTGDGSGSGVRRSLEGRWVQCEGESCPYQAQVESKEFLGSAGTCQGDSGGPALDEEGLVLGALSRGAGQCDSSTYSAVFGWADWMRDIGAAAADRGGYDPHVWVTHGITEIPEDDLDLDGVLVGTDNCLELANEDQADVDDDGLGDACDDDSDNDGVADDVDTCLMTPNDDQLDTDGDGLGDACDDDDDEDGISDGADFCPMDGNFSAYGDPCGGDPNTIIIIRHDDEPQGCQSSTASASPSWLSALAIGFGMILRRRRKR